jgi:site-specific DNA recombinase
MKNVVAYCRVSTDGQTGEDKFGIDAQKQQIMEYCQKNDMQISDWFIDEGVSGVKEDRPEFDKILFGEIENPPVECVVVAKSDRIAREIKLYFYYEMLLQKKGIELISVTEDFGEFGAFAPMLKAFTMIVAEQERININKRTSMGRGVKAQQGGYSGGKAPYGYEVRNKRLEVVESEAEVVQIIFAEKAKGNTLVGICDVLADRGYKSRKNGPFYPSNIRSILGNENTYRGMYRYGKKGEWVQGQQEPILKDCE